MKLSLSTHTQAQTLVLRTFTLRWDGDHSYLTACRHTFTLKMQSGVFLIQTLLYLLLNLCLWGQITRFWLSVNITAHSIRQTVLSHCCRSSLLTLFFFSKSYKCLTPDYLKIIKVPCMWSKYKWKTDVLFYFIAAKVSANKIRLKETIDFYFYFFKQYYLNLYTLLTIHVWYFLKFNGFNIV